MSKKAREKMKNKALYLHEQDSIPCINVGIFSMAKHNQEQYCREFFQHLYLHFLLHLYHMFYD